MNTYICNVHRVVSGEVSYAIGDTDLAVEGSISKIEFHQEQEQGVVAKVFVENKGEEKVYITIPYHAITRWMNYGKN